MISNIPQLTQKKSLFHRPITKNDFGTYFLNYAQENLIDGFSIEQFDSELSYVQGRFFDVGKKIYVLKVFSSDSGLYWISIFRKRHEKTKVYLNHINFRLEGIVDTKFVGEFDLGNLHVDQFSADYSQDRRRWSLMYVKELNHEYSEIGAVVYDISGTEIYKQKTVVGSRQDLLRIEESILTDSAKILATVVANIPRDFGNRGMKMNDLYLLRFSNLLAENKKIPLKNNYFNSQLIIDPATNDIILGGLYGDSRGVEIDGSFTIRIKQHDFTHEQVLETDFSETMIKKILGVKLSKKNREKPKNFYFRRMVSTSTGKLICIMEQYSESKQLETYYINGIPQTSTRILYHCGDMAVLFIDTIGNIDSCVMIRKDQTGTMYNLYLMGIATYVCKDGIHILYNSDIARNNEVLDVVIRSDYSISQKVLLNSDNFYNMIVPIDGKEMEYCTFTVPLYRDKQWFWMQINGHD